MNRVYGLYLASYLGLFVLLFFPLSIIWGAYYEKSATMSPTSYDASYRHVTMTRYNDEGQEHMMMRADHMIMVRDMGFITHPVLSIRSVESGDQAWTLVSRYAQTHKKHFHFFRDVRLQEVVVSPIRLEANDFWYNQDNHDFFADGSVVYRRQNDNLIAKQASGNIKNKRIHLQHASATRKERAV